PLPLVRLPPFTTHAARRRAPRRERRRVLEARRRSRRTKACSFDDRSAPQAEPRDEVLVGLVVRTFQVGQQALALTHHHQQPAAAVVVLLVSLQVLGELLDALGQHRDLNCSGAGVLGVLAEVLGDLALLFCGEWHVSSLQYSSPARIPWIYVDAEPERFAHLGQPAKCSTRVPLGVGFEPTEDRLQAHDTPVRTAGARQLVALAREAQQLHLGVAEPLDGREELLGLLDGAAPVLLAVDEEQRGLDLCGVPDGALAPQRIQVRP